MSALTEYLGAGHVFHHAGRDYQVSLLTQDRKAEFERRLFARHKAAERDLRDCYDAGEYSERLDRLASRYRNGDFALEGAEGQGAVKTASGMLLLVSVLFGIDEATALVLLKTAAAEVTHLVGLVLRESYALSDEEWALAQAEAEKQPRSKAEKNVQPASPATA